MQVQAKGRVATARGYGSTQAVAVGSPSARRASNVFAQAAEHSARRSSMGLRQTGPSALVGQTLACDSQLQVHPS